MSTRIEKISADDCKNNKILAEAAQIIKSGGLVAFPTETVYGLGANALDSAASKKIYSAKGRPSDNPLIAHISSLDMLDTLIWDMNLNAQKLIQTFWPGPLTLIFKKKDIVPFETTGGLLTVAVRMPSNKTALNLIQYAGVPIAAPSANSSGKPSPTSAEHVIRDLNGKIDMIIDGGEAEVGLESTIVDVSEEKAHILRPGAITKEMIDFVISDTSNETHSTPDNKAPKAPGMKYKHYAPKAEMLLVCGNPENIAQKIISLSSNETRKTLIMATEETKQYYKDFENVWVMGSRCIPESIAKNLFNLLRQSDILGCEVIYAEGIEAEGIGEAVMNRLSKACGYNIIHI